MVMFVFDELFVVVKVLAFHTQVRYDRVVFELEDEVLAVATHPREALPNELGDELVRF